MKKKIALILVLALAVALVGCGSTSTPESTETATEVSVENEIETATPEPTEAPHEHAYTETITTEATCETDGEKNFTCECGDSYTETITAVGHVFETYTSNNDATYLADGTETATCSNCDVTDTRTAEGSMLTYTYTDMDATMYAQQTVNVRSIPNTDGEKLGSLSINDEVKVTGQCVETSWYRIEYDGNVAYVSNSYLGNDKVVVQASAPAQTSTDSGVFPYETLKVYDDGGMYVYFYYTEDMINYNSDINTSTDHSYYNNINACGRELTGVLFGRYSGAKWTSSWSDDYVGTYNGMKYYKRYFTTVYDADRNVLGTW